MKTVYCRQAWDGVEEYKPQVREPFKLLKSYFFNGEGWYKLRAFNGIVFDIPDVFFTEPS